MPRACPVAGRRKSLVNTKVELYTGFRSPLPASCPGTGSQDGSLWAGSPAAGPPRGRATVGLSFAETSSHSSVRALYRRCGCDSSTAGDGTLLKPALRACADRLAGIGRHRWREQMRPCPGRGVLRHNGRPLPGRRESLDARSTSTRASSVSRSTGRNPICLRSMACPSGPRPRNPAESTCLSQRFPPPIRTLSGRFRLGV